MFVDLLGDVRVLEGDLRVPYVRDPDDMITELGRDHVGDLSHLHPEDDLLELGDHVPPREVPEVAARVGVLVHRVLFGEGLEALRAEPRLDLLGLLRRVHQDMSRRGTPSRTPAGGRRRTPAPLAPMTTARSSMIRWTSSSATRSLLYCSTRASMSGRRLDPRPEGLLVQKLRGDPAVDVVANLLGRENVPVILREE